MAPASQSACSFRTCRHDARRTSDEVHGSEIMVAFWRFVTIVLSALALTMTSAHVLELPQKMTYTAEMYAAVNTTLYRYFAIIGGPYQIGAMVSALVLTVLVRRQSRIFRWTPRWFEPQLDSHPSASSCRSILIWR